MGEARLKTMIEPARSLPSAARWGGIAKSIALADAMDG